MGRPGAADASADGRQWIICPARPGQFVRRQQKLPRKSLIFYEVEFGMSVAKHPPQGGDIRKTSKEWWDRFFLVALVQAIRPSGA
jgi:hypothetical protein